MRRLLAECMPFFVMLLALADLLIEYRRGNYPQAQIAANLICVGLLMKISDDVKKP